MLVDNFNKPQKHCKIDLHKIKADFWSGMIILHNLSIQYNNLQNRMDFKVNVKEVIVDFSILEILNHRRLKNIKLNYLSGRINHKKSNDNLGAFVDFIDSSIIADENSDDEVEFKFSFNFINSSAIHASSVVKDFLLNTTAQGTFDSALIKISPQTEQAIALYHVSALPIKSMLIIMNSTLVNFIETGAVDLQGAITENKQDKVVIDTLWKITTESVQVNTPNKGLWEIVNQVAGLDSKRLTRKIVPESMTTELELSIETSTLNVKKIKSHFIDRILERVVNNIFSNIKLN